jgi:hypothetical protein
MKDNRDPKHESSELYVYYLLIPGLHDSYNHIYKRYSVIRQHKKISPVAYPTLNH